jgi:hypothetical protein
MVCFAAMLVGALSAAVALWRLLSVRRDVQREWGGVIAGERVRDIKARGRLPGCSFCRYGDRPIPPLVRGKSHLWEPKYPQALAGYQRQGAVLVSVATLMVAGPVVV